MIINSETLDEILTNVSNSFLECESVQEICQLYAQYQNTINEQAEFAIKKLSIKEEKNLYF